MIYVVCVLHVPSLRLGSSVETRLKVHTETKAFVQLSGDLLTSRQVKCVIYYSYQMSYELLDLMKMLICLCAAVK